MWFAKKHVLTLLDEVSYFYLLSPRLPHNPSLRDLDYLPGSRCHTTEVVRVACVRNTPIRIDA